MVTVLLELRTKAETIPRPTIHFPPTSKGAQWGEVRDRVVRLYRRPCVLESWQIGLRACRNVGIGFRESYSGLSVGSLVGIRTSTAVAVGVTVFVDETLPDPEVPVDDVAPLPPEPPMGILWLPIPEPGSRTLGG